MPLRYDGTFRGRVQGVNFGWTTCRVGQRFDVTGWVGNERDGSVRCVAEGDPAENASEQDSQARSTTAGIPPEQLDARRILNALEEDRPDQFTRLFQFQGNSKAKKSLWDW